MAAIFLMLTCVFHFDSSPFIPPIPPPTRPTFAVSHRIWPLFVLGDTEASCRAERAAANYPQAMPDLSTAEELAERNPRAVPSKH